MGQNKENETCGTGNALCIRENVLPNKQRSIFKVELNSYIYNKSKNLSMEVKGKMSLYLTKYNIVKSILYLTKYHAMEDVG